MQRLFLLLSAAYLSCTEGNSFPPIGTPTGPANRRTELLDTTTWTYFLQHLPEKSGPILDYRGKPISFQQKHAAVIDYDTGHQDLQQCADALMRLRAEYLFRQKRFNEIHFHFVSGHDYSYADYCKGKRPVASGNNVRFVTASPVAVNHGSLRRYLDIVYAYASTISLARELKNADGFATGTVIITPGSPGHCFIICDEQTTATGERLYKLVEGYTPAQSIYILQNLYEPTLGVWHRLRNGTIRTASYTFTNYQQKKFE